MLSIVPFTPQDEISLDKPSSGGGGGLREPASLAHSAYSLAASAFSASQDPQLYINGAGLSYGYRGYAGLGAAMQHPVSLTTGAAASQSNGERKLDLGVFCEIPFCTCGQGLRKTTTTAFFSFVFSLVFGGAFLSPYFWQ